MTVSGCDVEVPSPGGALVAHVVVVDDERRAEPATGSWKGARAMEGHPDHLERPPIPEPGQVGHGLTELGLSVGVLNEVHLIDDVHQALRFRHAPEDLADP